MTRPGGAGTDPTLRVVHLVLGGGVLLFALVAVFLGPVSRAADPDLFRWIWLGVAVAAIFAAGVVRARAPDAARDPEGARRAAILTWALAEGQALVGLVLYLLGASSVVAILAVGLFLYLFVRYRPATFAGR